MAGRFVLKSSKGGKFRFSLRAGNGQVVLTSRAFATKQQALSAIASVSTNGTQEKLVDRQIAKNGKPFFNLKSTNGQVIGTSQTYTSAAAMEKGVQSVANNRRVTIDDQARTQTSDLTGMPAEIAHDVALVRSWRAAETDSNDPVASARIHAALARLNSSAPKATVTKHEFLRSTDVSVA